MEAEERTDADLPSILYPQLLGLAMGISGEELGYSQEREGHQRRERFSSTTVGEKMSKATTGSIMVIGGGIAGMQAALDAADSGYYVYLVERSILHRRDHVSARQDLPHQ